MKPLCYIIGHKWIYLTDAICEKEQEGKFCERCDKKILD